MLLKSQFKNIKFLSPYGTYETSNFNSRNAPTFKKQDQSSLHDKQQIYGT